MARVKVAIINASTLLSDDEVKAAVSAHPIQVHEELARKRGINPQISINPDTDFIPKDASPPADSWLLVVLDNPDQAKALGYGDKTKQKNPLTKVFVDAKHSLSIALGGPVFGGDSGGGTFKKSQ